MDRNCQKLKGLDFLQKCCWLSSINVLFQNYQLAKILKLSLFSDLRFRSLQRKLQRLKLQKSPLCIVIFQIPAHFLLKRPANFLIKVSIDSFLLQTVITKNILSLVLALSSLWTKKLVLISNENLTYLSPRLPAQFLVSSTLF